MTILPPDNPSQSRRRFRPYLPKGRRFGVAAFGALAVLLCSGATTSPTGCPSGGGSIGPSTGEVVGAAVGIGAVIAVGVVVLVEVDHHHHNLNGCVFATPAGLELQTRDAKRYMLEGDAATVKAGDRVKLQGNKVKKTKDNQGDQVFSVKSIKKDYGPCPANAAPTAAPAL